MTAEDSIPYVWAGIGLVGLYLVWSLIRAGRVIATRKWTSPWRLSFRLAGWLPPLGAMILLGWLVLIVPVKGDAELVQFDALRLTATLLPLIAGCHLAFAFSPADEPALEGLLSAPRPVAWILFERVILMAVPYVLLAVIGNAIVRVRFPDEAGDFFLRWIPPFLFFIAVAVMVTISSRQAAFGMTLTMILWFGLAFMGDGMLFRWPYLWPLHIYLQPEMAVSEAAYKLHQVWITVAGLGILARSASQLNDSEKLLAALKT